MTTKPTCRMTDAARERVMAQLATDTDDTNPEFLFSTTHTSLLLAIEAGLADPVKLARTELASRGLDASGAWCGFPKAHEIHLGEQHDDATADDATTEQAVAEIASRILRLDTLETRNSDALDFHELAVWTIRDALVAAYNAGAQAAGNGHATKQEG